MRATSRQIEAIVLQHSQRGMLEVARGLKSGYCRRAAELFRDHPGVVLIGTGFPVNGSFETDGPIGALALSRVLEHLCCEPVFVCGPPLAGILKQSRRTFEIPILDPKGTLPWVEQALRRYRPALIVSVERPGMAADGRYYNMRGQDISDATMKFDLFFEKAACPTIAFGDGGNEVGMGNIGGLQPALPITPSQTRCDELIVATVSNWGVYGVIAELSRMVGEDLFRLFDPDQIAAHLVSNGSLDGVTWEPRPSEDGFPLDVGRGIIQALRRAVNFDTEARRAAEGG
ncbi:MAG: DUF4392 domain-containing protein [Desulfobacterales bacterium]|nr:DUF4392 domain-containing protein [Desulfobacterales bacterium]